MDVAEAHVVHTSVIPRLVVWSGDGSRAAHTQGHRSRSVRRAHVASVAVAPRDVRRASTYTRSAVSVAEPDYAYETRDSVEARIDELSARARAARSEAEHARHQPGLLGPALSAEAAAKDLESEIASLREVAFRVAAGYPYWEPHGLELALDACGDPWNWQPLAEAVTRDYIFPHDEADIRLPLDAQRAYSRAAESGLFASFKVCTTFETDGYDEVLATYSYLVGVQEFSRLGAGYFFVHGWKG